MDVWAGRRYRRSKLVVVVGVTVALLSVGGGATAEPLAPPIAPLDLTEPVEWANPAAKVPGGVGVTPQITRITLGNFDHPAADVSAQAGTLGDVPLAEGYRMNSRTRTLTTSRATTGAFSAVGITWREAGRIGPVSLAVRHRTIGGAWSTWQTVGAGEPDRDPVSAPEESAGIIEPATWSPTTQQFAIGGQAPVRPGDPGDTPVPGQYDGDGRADLAIFHDGRFDIRGVGRYDVGSPGDIPMPLG
jgi:hypothetical protein